MSNSRESFIKFTLLKGKDKEITFDSQTKRVSWKGCQKPMRSKKWQSLLWVEKEQKKKLKKKVYKDTKYTNVM